MLFLAITTFALWGCGGSGGTSGGGNGATTVRVVFPGQQASLGQEDIHVSVPPQSSHPQATFESLLDDLKGLYEVRFAYAQGIPGVPANVARLLLIVTVPDGSFRTEEEIPLSTGRVTVSVPVGNDRLFEVRAFPAASQIPNFIGQKTENVDANGTTVTVNMEVVNPHPPVANAGPDQTVFVTQTVQLDGSRSSDVDGDLLTFRWTLTTHPPESQATLSNPTLLNPTFVVDEPGTYVVQLIVNDGILDSLPATVSIDTVNTCPRAEAGPNQTPQVGQTVQLNGSGSSDVDGDPLTFRWVFTTRPADNQATLSNPTLVNPTFVVDEPGLYVVQLIVNDGICDSLPATVSIDTVNTCPRADAGPNQTPQVGQTVQLNGSGSIDVDGDPLIFRWAFTTRPADSQATLSNPTLVNPTFVADEHGPYVAQLIVNDGICDSLPAMVSINTVNIPPVANPGLNQTIAVTKTVQLDGSGSSDVNGDPLTFRWAFTTRPADSQATLSNPTLVNPTFVADAPGTYVVQLIVSDGMLDSLPAMVSIDTVRTPPVANAGFNRTVGVGQTVQLDGSRSSDVDGDPLTFRWAFTTRPPQSQATLSNPTLVNPTFVADAPGTYVVQLIVNDGMLDSLPAMVRIDTMRTPPVANAGLDQTVGVGQTVQLDGSGSSDVDRDPLTFRWAFTTRPPQSQATLSNPSVVNPTFVADAPGTYVVQLIVNDGVEDSEPPDSVIITAGALPVRNCDDCFFPQALPFPFPFFGQTYTNIFVSNNGLVTFNFGTGDFTESIEEFTRQPGISPFWDDIITGFDSPLESGLYVNDQSLDQFVVTWFLQQEYCGDEEGLTCIGNNTIQLILFADGRIQFIYSGVSSQDSIVGITPGGVAPILEVDYSTERFFTTSGPTTILQQFTIPDPNGTTDPPGSGEGPEDPFDLDDQVIVFSPNVSGGYVVEVMPR
jgi:PKD domain